MSNADIGRSHALNAPWALKIIEGMDIRLREHRQFSNWVGQTSSKKKQNPSCFSWEQRFISMPIGEIYQSISQTRFSFDYFTVHTPDGIEADGCNKDDTTVKLETASDSNGSQATQYNVCSRRLSVMCCKGRRTGLRGYDSNNPPNMIVVFEDSNHDEPLLELPAGKTHGSNEISAEDHAYWTSCGCIESIIHHIVDNWKKLLEVGTAHTLRLVSTFLIF
jgi:hypothetical protein